MKYLTMIRTRFGGLAQKQKVLVVTAVCLVVGVMTFAVLAFSGTFGNGALLAKANKAAQTYTTAVKQYVSDSLLPAITKNEETDTDILFKDYQKRPPPPPSLDTVLTDTEKQAQAEPYPLPYAVSLAAVKALTPPKLENLVGAEEVSPAYAKAKDMEYDLNKMYESIIENYSKSNTMRQLLNDVSSFSYEISTKHLSAGATISTGLQSFRDRLAIAEKYYGKMVNNETREYVKRRYIRTLTTQFETYIKNLKIMIGELEAERTGDVYQTALTQSVNSYKEIAGLQFTLALSGFDTSSKQPSAVPEVNEFIRDYISH